MDSSIAFWNKKGVVLSNFKLPAILIHLVIVNPNIFTIVVDKINLTISEGRDNEYVLTASAFSDEQAFEPHEGVSGRVPLLDPKLRFYPIIIKPRSEEICWVVFMQQMGPKN